MLIGFRVHPRCVVSTYEPLLLRFLKPKLHLFCKLRSAPLPCSMAMEPDFGWLIEPRITSGASHHRFTSKTAASEMSPRSSSAGRARAHTARSALAGSSRTTSDSGAVSANLTPSG